MTHSIIDTGLLHNPARAKNLSSLEEHVQTASALARAAYLLMDQLFDVVPEVVDSRDRYALRAVIDAAADHASAAEVLLAVDPRGERAAPDDLCTRPKRVAA